MFESRISEGGTEKLPYSENFRISSWSCDMELHAKKCVERYCELANKTTQQLYKVSIPSIDDQHSKEEELKSEGELSKVCCQSVLRCLYLARMSRPDIIWPVNKFARSITTWTKAWDKHSIVERDCSKTQTLLVLEDSRSTSDGIQCVFGSRTFGKKPIPVSNSATESECVSLDAGLHMDGIPALDLWDMVTEVLHSSSNQPVQGDLLRDKDQCRYTNTKTKKHPQLRWS